jgi:starch-binding outer membrane protein, SusD/RagB family
MKTIFNIAISIALGCSCASCSDFLNLTPYSEITAENFYQNEEDFRQAVNGAYEPLRNMYNTEEWNLGEAKSDNTTYIIHIAKHPCRDLRHSH